MALIGSGSAGATPQPGSTSQEGAHMDVYEVEVNGVTTTLQLSDAEAEARGLKKPTPPSPKASKPPANKARTAPNKAQ